MFHADVDGRCGGSEAVRSDAVIHLTHVGSKRPGLEALSSKRKAKRTTKNVKLVCEPAVLLANAINYFRVSEWAENSL